MSIAKTRSVLYRISRILGDVQAVKRGYQHIYGNEQGDTDG